MGSRVLAFVRGVPITSCMAVLLACGQHRTTDEQAVSTAEDAGTQSEPAGDAAFDAEAEMAACDRLHSHVDCLFAATDRHFAGTRCGGEPIPQNPERTACLKQAYGRADEHYVICVERSEWSFAACTTAAACDRAEIQRCVDEQLARASMCPAPAAELVSALETCTKD